jgi:hypothetical protein
VTDPIKHDDGLPDELAMSQTVPTQTGKYRMKLKDGFVTDIQVFRDCEHFGLLRFTFDGTNLYLFQRFPDALFSKRIEATKDTPES